MSHTNSQARNARKRSSQVRTEVRHGLVRVLTSLINGQIRYARRVSQSDPPSPFGSAVRTVPRTGVIYVTTEAEKRGFKGGNSEWCNLGQGQPETAFLPGAPERVSQVNFDPSDQDYAPVAGLWEVREAVASLYNAKFRRGLPSQYSAENVAICGGGRVGLMRACAAVGPVHLGHFLPDYTAYAELLDVFRRFTPIPILLDPKEGYAYPVQRLRREVYERGLGALLLSNPCNPTGKNIEGNELLGWVQAARDLNCTMILDEFYSHYVWKEEPSMLSAAQYVEDVNRDPIVILDGLTKNWRYPGWRVAWIVGPKHVIEAASSAGSFLDGGCSRPMQQAALPMLTQAHAEAETQAIHSAFRPKRELLLQGLRGLGVHVDLEPEGTFYVWGDVSGVHNKTGEAFDGQSLFHAALEQKVIVVPGEFFDVDPGKRRLGRTSRFRNHVRFSFGPEMATLQTALERLGTIVSH